MNRRDAIRNMTLGAAALAVFPAIDLEALPALPPPPYVPNGHAYRAVEGGTSGPWHETNLWVGDGPRRNDWRTRSLMLFPPPDVQVDPETGSALTMQQNGGPSGPWSYHRFSLAHGWQDCTEDEARRIMDRIRAWRAGAHV